MVEETHGLDQDTLRKNSYPLASLVIQLPRRSEIRRLKTKLSGKEACDRIYSSGKKCVNLYFSCNAYPKTSRAGKVLNNYLIRWQDDWSDGSEPVSAFGPIIFTGLIDTVAVVARMEAGHGPGSRLPPSKSEVASVTTSKLLETQTDTKLQMHHFL